MSTFDASKYTLNHKEMEALRASVLADLEAEEEYRLSHDTCVQGLQCATIESLRVMRELYELIEARRYIEADEFLWEYDCSPDSFQVIPSTTSEKLNTLRHAQVLRRKARRDGFESPARKPFNNAIAVAFCKAGFF